MEKKTFVRITNSNYTGTISHLQAEMNIKFINVPFTKLTMISCFIRREKIDWRGTKLRGSSGIFSPSLKNIIHSNRDGPIILNLF
jgi:hypothetical protein